MDSWTIDLHLDRSTVGENGALDVKALGGVAVGVDIHSAGSRGSG